MFLDNKFTKEYFEIINKNKDKERLGYMEKHHIIPKSLGGDNSKKNLIWLSAKDHFKCHQLLVEITTGEDRMKMWSGLWRMMNKQSRNQSREYTFTPEEYEIARKNHAFNHSVRMLGSKNYFYGKKHTDNTKKIMSQAKKGKTYEEIFGKDKAEKMRNQRRLEQIGKIKGPQNKIKCPHCDIEGGEGIMKRWHFNNCKKLVR
jgi:hypothetical protein